MDLVNQRSIGWDSAVEACRYALSKAEQLEISVSVAVVDRSGQLVAFIRHHEAPFHCRDIATDKAFTAASFGLATDRWTAALENMSGAVKQGLLVRDRMLMFGGGIPILVDGERVGGIGVSGGSEQQDMECAIDALREIGADLENL